MNINEILIKENLSKQDLITLLSAETPEDIELIRSKAYQTMKEYSGEKVYLRGLIEFSNICINDCYYCGIRKSNTQYKRFMLSKEEILSAAMWSFEQQYGSLVLQSGERNDTEFIDFLVDVISTIKESTTRLNDYPNGMGITLCLGEQSLESYKRLFNAGAHRYLLRIETTNPILFKKIHPEYQLLDNRINCLRLIKEAGFQAGTGVMIGIPGQTLEDLANDIMFFKELDIDMIGMGPYIVHQDTPMNIYANQIESQKEYIYKLALKMIAVTRLFLKDVNIASTTALQAMNPTGREEGLTYGANVVMPLLTPVGQRRDYQLYDGKPCIDEFAEDCKYCLEKRIFSIGREIGYNEWGDSKHFYK